MLFRSATAAAPGRGVGGDNTGRRAEGDLRRASILGGAGGGGGGGGEGETEAELMGEEPQRAWLRSLGVSPRHSSTSAVAQVLLALIAVGCLVSGLCGQQRMDRLAAALGFKARKEMDADK